jgi:hypothetical protein
VDFNAKTAAVKMKPGQTLTKEACEKAFEGTKYKVSKFESPTG